MIRRFIQHSCAIKSTSCCSGLGPALVAVFLLFMSNDIYAGEATGLITKFHLNGGPSDRGACIQMQPTLTGTGWACLYKSNNLYKEITAMLLSAHVGEASCRIVWSSLNEEGHYIINTAEC
jgi:hypothetical protein